MLASYAFVTYLELGKGGMFKFILPFIISLSLFADFTWEGQNYHRNSASQQMAAFELLKEIQLIGNEQILDVGCGDGKITKELLSLVPSGSLVGLDLSPSQIAFAKSMETKNLSFEVGDIQELLYDQQFDLVTAFTAMQWVPDQIKGFKAIHRSLKPHGKLVLTVPTGITWQLSEAVREVITKDEWKIYSFQDKQHFFSREVYASLLREAGFTIESFKVVPSFNLFSNREVFTAFVKQWLPFVQDVPLELQDEFMRQVIDVYLELLPSQASGEVFFDKYVYNVIASRFS